MRVHDISEIVKYNYCKFITICPVQYATAAATAHSITIWLTVPTNDILVIARRTTHNNTKAIPVMMTEVIHRSDPSHKKI